MANMSSQKNTTNKLLPRTPAREKKIETFTYIFFATAVDSQLEPSVELIHATKAKSEVELVLV